MAVYCPVPICDSRPYADMEALRDHIKKALAEGEPNHVDIVDLEGWLETYSGLPVKKAADLDLT